MGRFGASDPWVVGLVGGVFFGGLVPFGVTRPPVGARRPRGGFLAADMVEP